MIIGKTFLFTPKINIQVEEIILAIINSLEISLVFFVFKVLYVCGIKENPTSNEPNIPI
tara:strand:+ start:513 stop:689 length:177 start_codon:yes stop_codon:yes gene_type:complete